MLAKLWKWVWTPSKKFAIGTIFVVGGFSGIIFWGGFNTFMEYTNTMEFCISCHEMHDTPYVEYQTSVHYANASGVRAICSDCHVPKDWGAKLWRKIKASNEIYHKLVGTIDTPEKYEAQRLVMAQRVWDEMKANDSRECRNCHSYDAMHWEKQRPRSSQKMQDAINLNTGETCIDCHKGIAHNMPKRPRDD